MKHNYQTSGVCAREVSFDLDGGKITNVQFTGGCNGNLKAITRLIDGCDADDVVAKCTGITCGYKQTSCADQLAKAIQKAKSSAK